ncbi:hypothetical protein ACGFNU_41255 [Spirillospora sp. NPDC048911]|uniref:hypothetical protein n=1 Tax=Spirillospora sp. NPDC048911 TaxID=3364527 RepID=UPI0037181EE1
MFPGPGLRALRAIFFAAVCVLMSAGTHVYAGGAPIPAATLGLAVLLVFGGAYALGGRERTLVLLLPGTFAAQYGLHHLFSRGAGHAAAHADPAMAAEHVHDTTSMTATSMSMALGHVIMALLTAFWLERGEARLCALVRWACERAVPPLLVPLPDVPIPARPLPAPRRVAVPVSEVLRSVIARRGPPRSISF